MKSHVKLYLKIFLGVSMLLLYCEYVIYFVVLRDCDWPALNPDYEDPDIANNSEESTSEPIRVMVLADTHLLGSKRGHWFDKLRREWQMHRAFQTAMYLHKPHLVFVLGDLTDEGLICSDEEFNYYVWRFHKLFSVPEGTRMFVVVGNHDIGFHHSITPYLNRRFVNGFNSTPVQFISEGGNHFVTVNSMALDGDGCFLCQPAEKELQRISNILECSKTNHTSPKCDRKPKLDSYSRPILLQHFPLYRPSDMDCEGFDAAPFPLKEERFKEKWDCLSKEATFQLLNQIKPRLVLSGHTHHGCTLNLPIGDGIEITIPSFSWRNKDNPNYGLLVISPNNFAFSKCQMPRETTVLGLYMFGLTMLFIWLLISIMCRRRRYKMKLR